MTKSKFLIFFILLSVVVFSLPRVLLHYLGENNPWTSFIYIYVLGGIFFSIGLRITLSQHALKLNLKADRIWFRGVILGYIFFLSLHGAWIYFALHGPQYTN